ncbi:aspartate aminotransferase family protein [Halorussus sp. MSC15.2]|nr:aspartate aminotransferase family protein [Halorussus sp. MSC15.2]
MRVTNVEGREFLDFASQTLNLNLGQCHPDIVEVVERQANRLQYTSSRYLDEPTMRLAKRIAEVAPEGLDKVNPKVTGGSIANEGAIKMARKKHDGNTIATTYGSFFGETNEVMRLSGKYYDKDFLVTDGDFEHFDPPYAGDSVSESADEFRKLAETREDLCGVILTPIDVNAGVVEFPKSYLQDVRNICDEHDIALIFDEVQTGFGWLGQMFAAEYYDVTPDIMTLAKGISAGYPLGAIVCREEYDVVGYGEHEFTHGANPIASAVAVTNIDILTQPGYLDEVADKGELLGERLAGLEDEFDIVDDVRRFGLIAGVDIVDDGEPSPELAEEIFEACLDEGIMFRLSGDFGGNSLVIKPPVIAKRSQIDTAIDTLRDVLERH